MALDHSPSKSLSNVPSGYDTELLAAYELICTDIATHDIPASISLEKFAEYYEEGNYSSVSEYIEAYYQVLDFPEDSMIGYTLSRSNWYYNTGKRLTVSPNYSKYNLLNVVQPGDIVYEAAGGSGITGHITIVEGIFFDTTYGRYYVRVIEAIGYSSGSGQGDGVCRGVLDDDRLDNRDGTILRVTNASDSIISGAISFCVGQIGKGYNYDFGKNTASSEKDWYCSELVWAAYKNEGIDIENNTNILGVLPIEIYESSLVTEVQVASIDTPQNVRVSMNGSNTANISWSPVAGAVGYYVYMYNTLYGSYSSFATVSGTSYSNYVPEGSTRYYRVMAYTNNGVVSNFSDPIGIKNEFKAPVFISMYTASSTSISFDWTAIRDASSYKVYRASGSNSNYSLIATTSLPCYTDTGRTSGTMYYYKVVAVNGTESTSMSGYRCKTATKVAKPEIYYAEVADVHDCLSIKWTYSPGATAYSIYYSDNVQQPSYTLLGTSTKTSYIFGGAQEAKTYSFRVVANSAQGDSEYSDTYYGSL
jgi:uncharacterized protein YycO